MSKRYFISRPSAVEYVVWEGYNLVEVDAFLYGQRTLTVNTDYSLHVVGGMYGPFDVQVGQMLTHSADEAIDVNDLLSSNQEVIDNSLLKYNVEEA